MDSGRVVRNALRVVVEVHAIMVIVGLRHSHVMGRQCMIAMVVATEVAMPGDLNTIVKKVPPDAQSCKEKLIVLVAYVTLFRLAFVFSVVS